MSLDEPLRVPIGGLAGSHATRPDARRILVVVHTVTALTRLLDVLALLESDPRVQVVMTRARHSAFQEGVRESLRELAVATAPWEQALTEEFDLAIAASLGDDLHLIKAPLIVLPHGVGYNKLGAPADLSAEGPYGLSRESLTRGGHLVPDALVLSHPEQRDRLAADFPDAVATTLVAGDPALDRIRAGLPFRDRYRGALGTGDRRLVLVSSTWGANSLVGQHPELLPTLLAQLPVDEFQVALALHPNVWHGHGAWQVRSWFAAAERAGLRILPPLVGWQAALVAADHVVGDHGSVTGYGAALATHTMVGTFPHSALDPASPIAALGRLVPVLDPARPLREQLLSDAAAHHPERYRAATDLFTAYPAESGSVLREAIYRFLELSEPKSAPRVVPPDVPVPHQLRWPHTAEHPPLHVTVTMAGERVRVERRPAELGHLHPKGTAHVHRVVSVEEPDRRWLDSPDIVTCPAGSGDPWDRLRDALTLLDITPAAATPYGESCLVRTRGGERYRLLAPGLADPLVAASAFCRKRALDRTAPERFVLVLGEREYTVTCTADPDSR